MLEAKAFKDLTKEEQETFLEKRKQISKERYETIKAANEAKRQKLKDFKQFVHGGNKLIDVAEQKAKDEGGLSPYVWVFNPTMNREWISCVLVMPAEVVDDEVTCICTYAIKSPSDIYKPHVGRGLCGTRLEGDSPWKFTVTIPKAIYANKKEAVQKAVSNMISTKVLLGAKHIPQRLQKEL